MSDGYLYEIFGEVVSQRDFLRALLITVTATFLMYFAAPRIVEAIGQEELLKALRVTLSAFGAFVGFIISSVLIPPKRIVEEG